MVGSHGPLRLNGNKQRNTIEIDNIDMEQVAEMFRWTDRDEDFFALFVWADDMIAKDGLLIRVFEEYFCTIYPNDSLLVWSEFFDILVLIDMMIDTI